MRNVREGHDRSRSHRPVVACQACARRSRRQSSEIREQVDAVTGAIATWSAVLQDCFDGLITLADVTGTQPSAQRAADIVVHFVPTAGGVVFGGYAICGDHGCPNIFVRSDLPPSLDRDPYTPEYGAPPFRVRRV